MDTVWVAYIRDRRHDLFLLDKKKYSDLEKYDSNELIVGIYDSQDKAERALDIVMKRMGWRGRFYNPNVWTPPDHYEYGWKEIPFNRFNAHDLYSISRGAIGR